MRTKAIAITLVVASAVAVACLPTQTAVWLDTQTLEIIRQRRIVAPWTDVPIYNFERQSVPTQVSSFLKKESESRYIKGKATLVRLVRGGGSGSGPGFAVYGILYGGDRDQEWAEWAEQNRAEATSLFADVSQALSRDDEDAAFKLLLDAQPRD